MLYCISPQASFGLMIRDVNEPEQSFNFEDWVFTRTLSRTYSAGVAFHNLGGYAPGLTGVIQVEDIGDAINRAVRAGWRTNSSAAVTCAPCARAISETRARPLWARASRTSSGRLTWR